MDIYKANRIAEGLSFKRAIAAAALATIRKSSSAEAVLRASWPRDEHAMLLLRSPQHPLSTTDYWSYDQIGAFRSLAPGSGALKLFDSGIKLDLAGLTSIRIPRVGALPPQPVFVAEGAPAPAVQFTTAATTLGPARKILVLSGVTRELNESTPDTAATVIGTVLADATNASIDLVAFDTNPADATRPAGLLHNVTSVPPSTITDPYMALAADAGNLAAAIGAARIDPSNLIYVAGPREAVILQMRGGDLSNRVIMTLGLPPKTVAAFAPSAVYSGYRDLPSIETRTSAAIHMESATPAEIVSTPGVVAAPDRSFFQTEVIAIKVRAWCAWAVAAGGVAVVNSINW
jgi:hypothetical protein